MSDFLRPRWVYYTHTACGTPTSLRPVDVDRFAREPGWCLTTFCLVCLAYRPTAEFTWPNGSEVGT